MIGLDDSGGIITLTPSWKTVWIVLLLTFSLALADQTLPVRAVNYQVNISGSYTAQAGYYIMLNATVPFGPTNLQFTISGAHFTYNTATSQYEAHVRSSVMDVKIYNTLESITDPADPATTGNLVGSATATWTQDPVVGLTAYSTTGDIPGMLYFFATQSLGVTMTWTVIVAAISLGLYNYVGMEGAMLWWLLAWGVFSVLVSGAAQGIGVLFMSLGGAAMLTKLIMGRRT